MMIWRQGSSKPAGHLLSRFIRGLNGGTGPSPRAPKRSGPGAGGPSQPAASPAKPAGVKFTLT
jgi:hypothetical protein